MKGFLLDTNLLSEFSRTRKPNLGVSIWMRSAPADSLFASVLTFAEILGGIELLPWGKRRTELREWLERDLEDAFSSRLMPVTKPIADRWAVLSARAQLQGRPLAIADGLIAATALEHNLTIVTRNVKDFAETGVAIFNPLE